MTDLGARLIKFFKWLLALIVAMPTALYLFLLIVNWTDRPPSGAALRFQEIIDARPLVADSDNAFIYANGFDVALDMDPAEWGRKRIDWAGAITDYSVQGAHGSPPGDKAHFRAQRSERIQLLANACGRKPGVECDAALENDGETLDQWLAQEDWVLRRYRTLIARPVWREAIPADITALFPPYQELLEGQKLLLSHAWRLAGSGDASGVGELLQEDIHFWRMVLVSADTLLTKMIATAAIDRHFSWSNLVFRQLPEQKVAQAIPASWQQPISELELSLERVFAGEWFFANQTTARLKAGELVGLSFFFDDFLAGEFAAEQGTLSRFFDRIAAPMLQLQDTSNRYANTLLAISETMRVPLEVLPQALQRAEEMAGAVPETNMRLYNPVGTVLLSADYPAYATYSLRVADLEGARRAALLSARLRGQTAVLGERLMQRLLGESDLRNPYTGEPFAWDEESGSIVFVGLVPGERGYHAFLY